MRRPSGTGPAPPIRTMNERAPASPENRPFLEGLRSRGGTPVRRGLVLSLILWTLAPTLACAQDRWSSPLPGVRYLDRRAPGPRRIFATVIDLCASGVSVRATADSEHHRTVPSYAALVSADVAVNADFYDTSTFEPTSPAAHAGTSWGATDTNRTGFLAFGTDRVLLSPQSEVHAPLPAWMREVVGGRPHIVMDGAPVLYPSSSLCTARHPRTMAGFSRDRRTLILAVVDGRSSASIGMTCAEESALLIELGADIGMNLDGGGSSTLWLRGDGVVNVPSDGTPRSVSNHLAIFADGSGAPSACMPYAPYELESLGTAVVGTTSTDIDGDERADLCVRTSAGVRCATSAGASFDAALAGPALSDDSGWSDPDNYRTIVMGDVTGDGLADLCARANAGIRCWPSTGIGFDDAIVGPTLSDASNWDEPRYYGTLGLVDVDGDGTEDLCARGGAGVQCWRSTGSGFESWGSAASLFSNDAGFGADERWATLRYLDLDGDGRGDVCGRAATGVQCVRSTGTDWDPVTIEGPAWTDARGWSAADRSGTLRVGDVDGDGMDDLCGRDASGFVCHLATMGAGFGPPISIASLSDANGFTDLSNWETLRLADLDADGDLDVCARADAGVQCFPFEDEDGSPAFGAAITGPALSDESGWGRARYYRTLRFADLDGDGDDDLCARAAAGMLCWPVEGGVFGARIDGPTWSDASGFWADRFHETLRFATRRVHEEPVPPDAGNDSGGAWDASPLDPRDGGAHADAGPPIDAGPRAPGLNASCSCSLDRRDTRGLAPLGLGLVLVLGLMTRRARRRGHPPRLAGSTPPRRP
jgi:hypothetical protein